MKKRYIYFFDELEQVETRVDGDQEEILSLLGGKGANLAYITRLGIPVPKGFTITAEACNDFYKENPPTLPLGLWEEQLAAIEKLERETGKKFGSKEKPLLVSCRSGAMISMPGMMDTVLNIGLNDETAMTMIKLTNNPRFVWDSYRRLIQGYGAIVLNIPEEIFENALNACQQSNGYTGDKDCPAETWKSLVDMYKKIILEETGKEFPQDPIEQIREATLAVFLSWNCERAIDYRRNFKISHSLGTAVNIMSMVFGNMGENSATGVAFTRNPATGENIIFGEYLINAQGEDVVAGVRNAEPIGSLAEKFPDTYSQFIEITKKLEQHFKDMQDVEFTIEDGKLWMLQTRTAKRTAEAAVKIAYDLVNEGLISKEDAVRRISPNNVDVLLHPRFTKEDIDKNQEHLFISGVSASPGAGVGRIYFTAAKAKEMAAAGQDVIMVRRFTKPDDVSGMLAGKGIITGEGGATCHAAVIARQLGIPAIVGCSIEIDFNACTVTANNVTLHEGDWISIDGSLGQVFNCQVPLTKPDLTEQKDLMTILKWADQIRSKPRGRPSIYKGPTRGLMVWANADSIEEVQNARKLGAEGIGLCRTEHMFLGDRAAYVRTLILSHDEKEIEDTLALLRTIQTHDFEMLFEAMDGLPTVIRLIDPPLHEFLPEYETLLEEVTVLKTRKDLGAEYDEKDLEDKEALLQKTRSMQKNNPVIGARGVRLCLIVPGLIKMQITSIIEGACLAKQKGFDPIPEIMVPLTMSISELAKVKPIYDEVIETVTNQYGEYIDVKFGTMIEIPRAALTSCEIAEIAEFYSFGTNDLHQMTLGLSRDDSEGSFMQSYYEWGLFKESPFQTIDQGGVGRLMKIAVKDGRKTRKDLVVGICGEHGGDPRSIDFCNALGMNYVSCSPYRIPVARLAAAQAILKGIR